MQRVEDASEDSGSPVGGRPGSGSYSRQQRAQRPSLSGERRSSSQSSGVGRRRSSSIPHAPPTLESEGLDDDRYVDGAASGAENSDGEFDVDGIVKPENVLSGWHYAPLIIAIVPPVGAVLGGHSDAWSDAILLALASFWLYQFLKVPHDIYHAARTRRILHVDAMSADEAASADPTNAGAHDSEHSRRRRREQVEAAAELRRAEMISLAALVASPLMGAWLLNWLMETFTDGNRYLNRFNIRLFMLASGIRPWSHALSLFRRRLLHLQEVVHYPSSRVEGLSRRLGRLESEMSTLRKLVATKSDVSLLREGIDLPLTQLSRSMRRYERKEENLRLSAEDKFGLVEARLEDLLREVAINAELIEEERRERQRAASLPASIFQALKYALGQRRDQYSDYDARSITGRASLGIQAPEGASNSVLSQGSTSSLSSAEGLPDYAASPRYGGGEGMPSASLPPYMQLQKSVMRQSPGWTQEGLAYWVFWPINIPRSLIQTALSYAGAKYAPGRDGQYPYNYQPALISHGAHARAGNAAQRGNGIAQLRGSSGGGPASPPGPASELHSPQKHTQQSPLSAPQQAQQSQPSSRRGKVPSRMRTGGSASGSQSGSAGGAGGEALTAGSYGRRM